MEKKIKTMLLTFLLCLCLAGGALAEAISEPMPEEISESVPEAQAPVAIEDKDSIRQAQKRLIRLGFLDGKADGVAGPMTEAAVRAFQAQYGMAITGVLDEATLEALKGTQPSSGSDGSAEPEGGISTKEAQQRLIELGYLSGAADGKWGKQSKAAMRQFQQLHGLEMNGELDYYSASRLFAEDAKALPTLLKSGASGDEVAELQSLLLRNGFLDETQDGTYGRETVAAVRSFQQHLIDQGIGKRYGVEATGEATPMTRYILMSPSYSSYLCDVAAGEQSEEALRVERRLYNLGYMDLPADDTLDDYGLAALELFKARAGVLTFGAADRSTIEALFSEDAPKAERCAWHDIASGDQGLVVLAVEEALCYGGMTVKIPNGTYDDDDEKAVEKLYQYLQDAGSAQAGLFSDPKALTAAAVEALTGDLLGYVADVGSKSKQNESETARVQRRLYALYYMPRDEVDGKFGGNTRDAIKEFQKANGLDVTGTADRATQEVLFSEDADVKPFQWQVRVSIADQRVRVYARNDQGGYDLDQTFICSTGLHDATPRGVFLDGRPLNRWHFFKDYYCWAQYSFEIKGDIMFHSVIYGSKSENSLRSSSVHNLGRPASHGCVRLKVEDAKWLYENCKRGTVVIIVE